MILIMWIYINLALIKQTKLIKSWYRRQKWQSYLFNSTAQDLNRSPWRTQLANFLESTSVHVIVILLLHLDLIFTILELSSSVLSCPHAKANKIEKPWYYYVGIAILSMLAGRALPLAVGLDSTFFRRSGYVVDSAVVVGALVLEALLETKGGGLPSVVSFWLVVRVVESAFELSDEAIGAQIEEIVCQFEALWEENRRLLEGIGEKDKIIEMLQKKVLDQFLR
jgi:hypothetical protein